MIVYQDADDLPHPQRVQIARRIFTRYEIDHLMHAFYHESVTPQTTISTWRKGRYDLARLESAIRPQGRYVFDGSTTNGNPIVRRHLALEVGWPEAVDIGEDVRFNQAVYARSRANAVLAWSLLLYRQHLSAGRPR